MPSIISSPLITLSVVSHGNAETVIALVESVLQYERFDTVQLIITDNIGEQGFREKLPQKALFFHNHTPRGFAHNHNQAFKYAKGEYFCILNPDIIFIEPLFKYLISYIGDGHADIISPLIVDSKNMVQDSFRELPTPTKILARRLGKKQRVFVTAKEIFPDWLAGMFLFMRSDTFEQLGGFDERYFLYFEDVDFCTRARLAGFQLLLESALKVQHDAHRGSQRSLRYLLWHLHSAVKFFSSETYRKAKRMA